MINIRRNIFETNSSSTHCLTLNSDQDYEVHEELFLKEYIIKPWSDINEPPYVKTKVNSENAAYDLKLTSIEDKLTYFLTVYYQANYSDYMSSGDIGSEFLQRLQKLFPNTVFALKCDDSNRYILEDGEYLFDTSDYGEAKSLMALTDDQLKTFMEYGVIYFGDRNYGPYSDFIYYSLNSKHILVKFSGQEKRICYKLEKMFLKQIALAPIAQ